jgi:hypothetical protein
MAGLAMFDQNNLIEATTPINNTIGKLIWDLAGAPGTFCVERTPEGRK